MLSSYAQAVRFSSAVTRGTPVARWFARHGYQTFVVNYRVRPYTSRKEVSIWLVPSVSVRLHSADYGIDPNDIASVGFSAGGILCGDEALNFDELVNGTALASDNRPDCSMGCPPTSVRCFVKINDSLV